MVAISVETQQKSCAECLFDVLSVSNVFPVFVLVGDVLRLTGNGFMVAEIQNADRLDNMLTCMHR